MKSMMLVLFASTAMAFSSPAAATQSEDEALLPYEQFTLPNGLRVVVHEDHSAPKVAVTVWYHVGSMNEPAGQTGFAHLFEHLMFNGSEHRDDEYMPPLQEIGASAVNGATTMDQTYYYAVVPTGGLERVLWLDSDRMGYLLGAVTQEKLDEQRGVVQNEKRTRDNQPYSMMPELRARAIFPSDHPYHHPIIGSMEDLDAASLDDVHAWFHQYYGASNAVVALAGDVTVEQARELMTRYFASVPPGPPIGRMTEWTPVLERTRTEVIADNVPQTAISWSWPVPGDDAAETRRRMFADPFPYLLLVDDARRPIGWVDEEDVPTSGTLREEMAIPMSPLLDRRATLKDALSMLLDASVQAGIVVDRTGAVLGLVTVDMIAERMRETAGTWDAAAMGDLAEASSPDTRARSMSAERES